MLKDFSWRAFETTGNIDAYMFFKEIQVRGNSDNDKNIAEEEVTISN